MWQRYLWAKILIREREDSRQLGSIGTDSIIQRTLKKLECEDLNQFMWPGIIRNGF
jgi:hypothetical protein